LSTEKKSSIEEGGDVYLDSTSTQSEHDFWLIDLGASLQMTLHSEWFYEYEKYNGNVFLGDNSPKKIVGCGRVKLLLNDGRVKTLLSVLYILGLAINLISTSKMVDAGVKTVFEKERYKMVWGEVVLMRGVQYGTLYKLLGRTVIDGCNDTIVTESKNEEIKVIDVFRGDNMLWHQGRWHIGEKGLQSLQGKCMVEGICNFILDFDFCKHYLYGKHDRAKFPSGVTREKEILELIQSDLFFIMIYHTPCRTARIIFHRNHLHCQFSIRLSSFLFGFLPDPCTPWSCWKPMISFWRNTTKYF
jgi:hypothetical protein